MSLLKVNEVQNYNGSSLTLTASTVSTSAQLNTGGNISVTGSINVSDDSTTRSNLGLGSMATQNANAVAITGGTLTLTEATVGDINLSNAPQTYEVTGSLSSGSNSYTTIGTISSPIAGKYLLTAFGTLGTSTAGRITVNDGAGTTFLTIDAGYTVALYSLFKATLITLDGSTNVVLQAARRDSGGSVDMKLIQCFLLRLG